MIDYPDLPYAPRLDQLIGRKGIIHEIRAALASNTPGHIFYLVGKGGLGKTRLLEEIGVIQANWQPPRPTFLWSGIIDLYHAEYHGIPGLRHAIVTGLDPQKQFFQKYNQLYQIFSQKQQVFQRFQDDYIDLNRELNELNAQLDQLFKQEYRHLTRHYRLVLCFDTLEHIQYETEPLREICQVEDDHMVKNWLIQCLCELPQTITLLASRPHPELEKDFNKAFHDKTYRLINVDRLNDEESYSYLYAMREQKPELQDILAPSSPTEQRCLEIAQGKPIRLAILIDLLLNSYDVREIAPVSTENARSDERAINDQLVDRLWKLPPPVGLILQYLKVARKGLDIPLFRHLAGDTRPDEEIQQDLNSVRKLALVKTRPQTQQIFLHDEIYDWIDAYFQRDPSEGVGGYQDIAIHYRQRLKAAISPKERAEIKPTLLYYEMLLDPQVGYYQCYLSWVTDAIVTQANELDMHLRDEELRFVNRYANVNSPYCNPRIARLVDIDAITRDQAVHWVKRYLAQKEISKARQVIESLLSSQKPIFDLKHISAPYYQADLLKTYAEVLIECQVPYDKILPHLKAAISLLEPLEDHVQPSRRSQILSGAYNNAGYIHRIYGSYGLALKSYQAALEQTMGSKPGLRHATIHNNMAYLWACMSRFNLALNHLEQALKTREDIGKPIPIALSYNTRGLIYTLQGNPRQGEQDCREALRQLGEAANTREASMVYIGLAFTLRKRANLWVTDECSLQDAERDYQEALTYLQKVIKFFTAREKEPVLPWEAYNELGCLYQNWAWFAAHFSTNTQAPKNILDQYNLAIENQLKALEIAKDFTLGAKELNAYDDLAQTRFERAKFLLRLGRVDEALNDKRIAWELLAEIEKRTPMDSRANMMYDANSTGEYDWLALMKIQRWRSIWTFCDLKTPAQPGFLPSDRYHEAVQTAIRACLCAHYFSPVSRLAIRVFEQFLPVFTYFNLLPDMISQEIKDFCVTNSLAPDISETLMDLLSETKNSSIKKSGENYVFYE